MNISKRAIIVSFLIAPSAGMAAEPPTAPPAVEKCANIKWSPAFLERSPKAPAACRGVEVRDGIKFATFAGKVAKVGATYVEVAILDVGDFPLNTIAFEVGVGGRVTVGDTVEKVKDLKVGDKLTFWVREGEFGVSPTLEDKPMRIVKPEVMPGA